MTHMQFPVNGGLNIFYSNYKRPIIYTVILLLVILGQHFTMQMSVEPFRYIRQSVMSMLVFLCFTGAFVLLLRKKWGRADALFLFLMIIIGATNLISLTRGLTTGYASVVQYKYMSFSMLVYGSVYAYFFQLYPIETFRPGWLTFGRALLLFLPTIVVLAAYMVATRLFHVSVPVIDDWHDLVGNLWNVTVWLRLFGLFYPVFGLMIMLRYRRNYKEWCENNFASMEHIDAKWLGDYIFGNFVITFSCLVIVFSNNFRSALVHTLIFLFFFLYGFFRVFFQKNPYPEGYFRAGMNEKKLMIKEAAAEEADCTDGEEECCPEGEEGIERKCLFTSKLPEYRDKLEQWMATEKPYLRKDFKLTDAMQILPLNRSYLSRLFNEGYGERFYHFVMRYRIAESKQLLLSRPDLTITTIAEMSGFSSPSIFGRAFTQVMKCSPMQWRERESSKNNFKTNQQMKRMTLLLLIFAALCTTLTAQETHINLIGNSVTQGMMQEQLTQEPHYREYPLNTVKTPPLADKDPKIGLTAPSLRVYLPSPERATGRMVIALPGGGYSGLAMFHEGVDWAEYFLGKGIAFGVLKYRMPAGDRTIPYADVAAAFALAKAHAGEWNVHPDAIGIMGSSAGGHLASTYATHTKGADKPAFQILLYPVITMDAALTHAGSRKNLLGENPTEELVASFSNELRVEGDTPPAFIIFAADDKVVPPANGLRYAEAMTRHERPVTFLLYPSGGHGFGNRESFAYKKQFLLELDRWLEGL